VSYQISERRACRAAWLNRGNFRYRGRKDPRKAMRMRIREIAQARVHDGYRTILVLLNREGAPGFPRVRFDDRVPAKINSRSVQCLWLLAVRQRLSW
jgi:hypothetical protein